MVQISLNLAAVKPYTLEAWPLLPCDLQGVQDLIYPFWLWYPSRPEPNNCLSTVVIPIFKSTASRCNCSKYGMNQLNSGKDLLSKHLPWG